MHDLASMRLTPAELARKLATRQSSNKVIARAQLLEQSRRSGSQGISLPPTLAARLQARQHVRKFHKKGFQFLIQVLLPKKMELNSSIYILLHHLPIQHVFYGQYMDNHVTCTLLIFSHINRRNLLSLLIL